MKIVCYKTDNGYIVTYPTKVIHAGRTRIPSGVLVCGRGPTAPNDPTTITDAIFQPSDLGIEVAQEDVPDKWREALGLPALQKRVAKIEQSTDTPSNQPEPVKVDIDFGTASLGNPTRVLVLATSGAIIGLLITYLFYV